MAIPLPASVRSYLNEPAVPDPPVRVWRDWVLVAVVSVVAVLEATLRTDDEWVVLPVGWRVAATVVFFAVMPISLLERRRRPLAATASSFGVTMAFGVVVAIAHGPLGGLTVNIVVLVVAYALYRWGSGRDGAVGLVVLIAAAIVGNLADRGNAGDVIGGLIVLSLPVELGLLVRYRRSARDRAIDEAKSREREDLARELHDTVAHHVSAIAVQAQAGQALAASDPDRAVAVLGVIERAASTTLAEMRAMVGTLRNGADADLAPQQGVADLGRLALAVPGAMRVDVDIDDRLGELGPALDAAIYRIAQESITNALRHARAATRVSVRVDAEDDVVRLTVTDDGISTPAASHDGFGLLGMTERAHLLGGRLEAGPVRGNGWRVTAELPLVGVTS